MDTSRDSEGSTHGRLWPSKQTAVVALLVALLVVQGVALAAHDIGTIDEYEDGDVSEYSEYNMGNSSVAAEAAYNGTYGLKVQPESDGSNPAAVSASGLDRYPQAGDTFEFRNYHSGTGKMVRVYFAAQSEQNDPDGYAIHFHTGILRLYRIDGGSFTELARDDSISQSNNQWFRIRTEWGTTGDFNITAYNETGHKVADIHPSDDTYASGGIGVSGLASPGPYWYFDSFNVTSNSHGVRGTVTDDTTDEPIEGATVDVINNGSVVSSDTTNSIGQYEVPVDDGTYTVRASKANYQTVNETVQISGDTVTEQDFRLVNFNDSMQFGVRDYMEHGQRSPYSVVVERRHNGSTARIDVTENATVTSNNTSVVSVDSGTLELVATTDTSVNQRTRVTAEWTGSNGNTFETSRNVTVANKTVNNVPILPTGARIGASLEDTTIQVILVATIVGVGAATVAGGFAGLSSMAIVVTLGWIAGRVGNGMLIVGFMMALFIGLNIAANINYSMRGGR